MRRSLRQLLVIPLTVVAVAASSLPAYADNLLNSLGASGQTTINLTGPGAGTATVNYWIFENSAGGLQGCDARVGSPATVSILAPAGVTASPASLVFTACGTATTNTKTVTFSSAVPGTYTIAASVSDDAGRYNTDQATFTLRVVQANTPPAVAVSGVQHGASYEKGAVPAAFCNSTDAEDGATTFPATVSAVTGPLAGYGLGSVTASCEVTDSGGLTASASATYTVVDRTAPTLTLPGDVTVEAADAGGGAATFAASASDAVDPHPAVSCDRPSGAVFPLGATAVTCQASDAAGNIATGQFTVRVQDTTAPVLDVPASRTLEATGPAGATAEYTAGAHDTVDGALVPACQPPSGATFPLGRTPVNCTATDAAGNTGAAGFDVAVVDTTAPRLLLPADRTAEATGPFGAAVSFDVAATDLVDGDLDPVCDSPSGAGFPLGTTTVSCTAVDSAGNLAAGSFTVTIVDTTAPELALPEDLTREATKAAGADIAYAASASDLVDGSAAVDCNPANGTFGIGVTTVTCRAADAAGNVSTGSFTVTVADTTAPVLTGLPADQVVEATGPDGAAATFAAPTATDVVDGDVAVDCDAASGAAFPLGVTTVTCTATDARGNAADASFTVTIVDTIAPVVAVPDNQLVEATGPDGATASWAAVTASDAVSGPLTATCAPAAGMFPLGVTTVTCTAIDAAGNVGTAAFTVTVQDRTAPVVTVPDNQVVEATGPDGAAASWTAVTASDTVDGDLPVGCDRTSGATFAIGATTVTCTATDKAGNTGHGAFVVTVVDTTAPALTVPADRTVEATSPAGAPVAYRVSAADLVDGDVAVECMPAPGSVFALGETAVACTAIDARGNAATGGFTVTVVDTTAPELTVPADRTVEATGPAGALVTYQTSAADLVDGDTAVTCDPPSGVLFPLGLTQVTCTATDGHGNTASASFAVTVADTTAPALELPGNLTATATSARGAAVGYTALARDLVDGASTPVCTPAQGSVFAPGTTRVECVAVDAAGNRASAGFTVTVAFQFAGFNAPVDAGGTVNVIKGGSTVPLKWQLPNQSGGYIGDLGTVVRTASGVTTCGGGSLDDLAQYATGGTSLRYDSGANQYIYNWQSPKTPGRCYQVSITLTDGRTHSAQFQLR